MDCIFCKIRDREIPKEFTYEDEDVMVFPDIHPQKPIHLLVVSKKHIADFLDFKESVLWEKIRNVIQLMIGRYDLQNQGYRLEVNGGGAQIINHMHIHILGPMFKPA